MPNGRDYYNTNREVGSTLMESRATARTQQERILEYFQIFNRSRFSPHEIRDNVFENIIPLTSVRRAMTNLTDAGYLEKTIFMKEGSYGKQVHTWRLRLRGGETDGRNESAE